MTTPTTLRWALLSVALFGCASAPPPRALTPDPSKPFTTKVITMAVMPPDTLLFSDVAVALGDHLSHTRVSGTAPPVTTRVSMEVAQLSLECVAATDECFVKVGRYLQVDRLLWGQIEREKETGVKVTVAFLDVGRGAVLGRAEASFAGPAAAIPGLQKLIDDATKTHTTLPLATGERHP